MQLIAFGSLLAFAVADLVLTSNFTPVTPLENQTRTLKVIFFDFDKTLMVMSFGDYYLGLCGGNCTTYHPTGPCDCNATEHAFGDFWNANYSESALFEDPTARGINGTARRDRLLQTFAFLASREVKIRVLSTSWWSITAASWAYFLSKVFVAAGLDSYLNLTTIITLDDPGEGISADKGSRAKQFMDSVGATFGEALLVDDSSGNMATAAGKVDFVRVFPQAGIALDLLTWIEQRANITDPCPRDEIQEVFNQCRVYHLTGECPDECSEAIGAFVNASAVLNKSFAVDCLRTSNASQPWVNGALDILIQRFQNDSSAICLPPAPAPVDSATGLVPAAGFALVGALLLV